MSRKRQVVQAKLGWSQKTGRRAFYLTNLHESLLKDLGKAAKTKQFRDNVCSLNCIVEKEPLPLEKESRNFYQMWVYLYRRSYKTKENFEIMLPNKLLDKNAIEVGTELEIIGQFWNIQEDEMDKPIIMAAQCNILQSGSVYAGMPRSSFIYLEGYIVQPIVYDMFNGKMIAVILLEINKTMEETDQILCIAWGKNARNTNTLKLGDKVKIYGNVQNKSNVIEICEKWYVCIEHFIKIENIQQNYYLARKL